MTVTAKTGVGLQAAGSTPAGAGTPTTATALSGSALIDQFGNQTGSRKIDSVTKQYVFNSDGHLEGENDIRHLVKLVVMTVKGSSAWKGGLRPFGGVIGAAYKQRIENYFREALLHLTSGPAPFISIEAIQITRVEKLDAVAVRILLQYRDLLNNELNSIEVG